MIAYLRRYFFAGLLFWVPIWVTLLVINFIFQFLNKIIAYLPIQYQPNQLLGLSIPGLNIIVALLIISLTGILVTNFLGRRLVGLWDVLVARIPVVRTVYSAVKQVLDTILNPSSEAFRKVLLIEYPRKGVWSFAFQTGSATSKITQNLDEEMLTVFVPTTPNPTSGFLIVVPKQHAMELDMSVDEALKLVISLGVVQPTEVKTAATDNIKEL